MMRRRRLRHYGDSIPSAARRDLVIVEAHRRIWEEELRQLELRATPFFSDHRVRRAYVDV